MPRKYEMGLLSVLCVLVIVSTVAAIMFPPAKITARPKLSTVNSDQKQYLERRSLPAKKDSNFSSNISVLRVEKFFNWEQIEKEFNEHDYLLEKVASKEKLVPRIFISSLPKDLASMVNPIRRKNLFFKIILPLVLKENERIKRDRARLWGIVVKKRMGRVVPARDRLWIAVLADRFKVDRNDVSSLLKRVDIIPPSLALAQAAEESGWGTSRFAKYANAVFGQWTTEDDSGLVPRDRDSGKTHKIKKFETLSRSISAYMRNLNTHRAYRNLRKIRSKIRTKGTFLSGMSLVKGLKKYSERGQRYVKILRQLIRSNQLGALDHAKLEKKHSKKDRFLVLIAR